MISVSKNNKFLSSFHMAIRTLTNQTIVLRHAAICPNYGSRANRKKEIPMCDLDLFCNPENSACLRGKALKLFT